MENNLNKRYVAHIVMEALSPLKIGSSDIDMLQDSPIQKDWNGLPMILGTSIAGVLRRSFDKETANKVFGDENTEKAGACASRLIISNALLCDEDMKVHEGLGLPKQNIFLESYESLPLREHVCITGKGVADVEEGGKFDEEVVYKGSRFICRLEFLATDKDEVLWESVLKQLQSNTFRLGGGTTKGFGEMQIIHELSSYGCFDLDSQAYSTASASLNTNYDMSLPVFTSSDNNYDLYTLHIEPEDFFLFGSGFGDDDADQTAVKEKVVLWEGEKGAFSKEQILLPATSLKGAIAHRTAFYYNKMEMAKTETYLPQEAKNNEAVKALFGEAKESNEERGSKGKVLFSDLFKADRASEKVFDHVKIDRFTGGAIDSALFNEKVVAQKDNWQINILLSKEIVNSSAVEAFESTLKDITTGMLALGGATTKGHGVFVGSVEKNGERL